jgi:hypothetical protein
MCKHPTTGAIEMHFVVWVNGQRAFETLPAPTAHEAERRLVHDFFVHVVVRTFRHDAHENLAAIYLWYMKRVRSKRDVFDAMCDLVKHDCGFTSFHYEESY